MQSDVMNKVFCRVLLGADSNIHRMKNSAETSVTVNVVFNYKNNERTQLQSPLQRAS
jgi:hypothetical protein